MHRRFLLAALAAAAVPGFAPSRALAAATRVPLTDAFLLLEDYLKLAPGKRDLFHFAYLARRKGKLAPDAKATYVLADGTRTPVVFAADGEVTNLPTLEALKSKAKFETDGPPFEFGLEMRASFAPAAQVDVATLARSLAQANAAIDVFASGQGARLTDAYFPGAGAGRVASAGGQGVALAVFDFPNLGPIPYLDLRHDKGATTIELDHAPSRILFGGPPHRT